MSQVPAAVPSTEPAIPRRAAWLLLPVVVGVLALAGSLQPVATLLLLVGLVVLFAILKWPEASTLTVLFILYSNAAAIAVEFHGVPYILGGAFILLLGIPLAFFVLVRREPIFVPTTFVLLVLFVLVQAIGAFTSLHPDLASKELLSSVIEGLILYFLTINVIRSEATLRRCIWTLVAAGALVSLAPIYQQATGNFSSNLGGFGQVSAAAFAVEYEAEHGPVQPRLAGSVGEQNRYAQVMLMLLPLALFRWWGERQFSLRMAAMVASVLITLAVVLTFSRGAAVGLAMIVLAMAGLRYIRFRHLAFVFLGFSLVLLAIPQYATRMMKLQGVWALMDSESSGFSEADGSLKSRFTEMGAAALVFVDHPLIGVGPGMFRYHYRDYAERIGIKVFAKGRGSHSLYPGLAAESGSLGILLFSAIVLITLRDLIATHRRWRTEHPERANTAASFVLVLVAYLTTGMFLHLGYVRFFWLMMAVAHVAGRMGRSAMQGSPGGEVTT